MSVLRTLFKVVGASWKAGYSGGAAIGNAINSRSDEVPALPISGERWAKLVLKITETKVPKSGRVVNGALNGAGGYVLEHILDDGDPIILGVDGHLGNAIVTLFNFTKKGHPGPIGFLCPLHMASSLPNDQYLRQLNDRLSPHGMWAECVIQPKETRWKGGSYRAAYLTVRFDEQRTWHP